MTPKEVSDALWKKINTGQDDDYEKVLDQLWSGDLTIQVTDGGYLIRATTAEEQAAHVKEFTDRGLNSNVRR